MESKQHEFGTSAVAQLARRLGIELDYINAAGERVSIAPDVIHAVLDVMGYRAQDDSEANDWLSRIDENERSRTLPPVLVVKQNLQPIRIPFNVDETAIQDHAWRLFREDGEMVESGTLGTGQSAALTSDRSREASHEVNWLNLRTELPCGYHRVELDHCSMSLIVVPEKCWLGSIEGGQRLWGIAAQLYLLRSEQNWGIGDFTDLRTLIDIAAEWGASVIGLNPLHALFLDDPEQASPYSPASRLYLNILNIDVTAIPEFATCQDAKPLLISKDFASTLNAVRAADQVNYKAVAALKLRMLDLLYADFVKTANPERRQRFEDFVRNRGERLKQFCVFQAIRLDLASRNQRSDDLQQWPSELRDPDSQGTQNFIAQHRKNIDFLIWTQWIADEQLRDAASKAQSHKMKVGFYRDLAVGSSAASAEVWSNPQNVAARAHAGAPPDLLNPAGQDWGLSPLIPRALYESSYAPFIELVRANMRYCGALRIDHVIGLQHLYWVPAGRKADQGAYVAYPFDDLVGILALESQRNHCVIVGEGLGTVPPGFSEKLNERGILSYRVLYFEQDQDSGKFIPPDQYRSLALATVGSHDLATLRGWWLGDDITIREQHALYPDPLEAERQRKTREEEKEQLLAALLLEGLDPGDPFDFDALSRAVHTFLARSGSAIAIVQLENLTGEISQTNLPATSSEHPNWRRRLSESLENLRKRPEIANIIEAVRRERAAV
ncbi:MAG TPA: 4-alpha-glucanotransferase [Candidatus Binataceae bacterium]|nr:4-alpha-glucanotransferase [Candidatus Binataceae bacterium]